ncbi:hypothetical protein [Paraliobacillus ryukyuensis]|uniref:hypothetical protein n=1 Tax=Paraliobacillus ryukyuensis TaxID=200904 RepID=UPI0015C48F60|nr:hypothetical protein [Paraliobacillus ryukyuensis]
MAHNFQTKSAKYTKNRYGIYESEFANSIDSRGVKEEDNFTKNLNKYKDFVSWCRFYPDLFYDLITPETGGIRLDLDQRLLLRSLSRFVATYGVFPRGYGKTMIELMGMYHTAICFPDIELSMTAQTRENASKLVDEKHREIIKNYPLMKNEITKFSATKDSVEIIFTSGGRIDILANQQSTKGARRKRLNIEEAAQLNSQLFYDVLEPVVNVPRRTVGREALVNPEELHGQINFFTTSWFRGSDEYERNLKMIDDMVNLKGTIVIGSDWQLAASCGRGEPKAKILDKKAKSSPTFFAMNYESKWVGSIDGSLVDINKVMSLRVVSSPEYKSDNKSEYILSMDVARSDSMSNNQSSIAVLKLNRSKSGKIKKVRAVNIINLPNGLNFASQAMELKKVRKAFNAKIVVIDGNGLGTAIIDEVMKDSFDPQTGEELGCWDTINTDRDPESSDSEKIVYDLHAQGINSDIIVNFIDYIESEKILLLEKTNDSGYDINDDNAVKNIIPFLETDKFIEEVANLKLKKLQNGKYNVERVVSKIDKDRYSAVAYGLWYIKNYEDNTESESDYDFGFFYN